VRGIDINTPRYTTVFGKDATSTPWTGYDKAEPRAIPVVSHPCHFFHWTNERFYHCRYVSSLPCCINFSRIRGIALGSALSYPVHGVVYRGTESNTLCGGSISTRHGTRLSSARTRRAHHGLYWRSSPSSGLTMSFGFVLNFNDDKRESGTRGMTMGWL
jgi:hypothetical protein